MIRLTDAKTSPAGPPPTMKPRAAPAVSTASPTRSGFDMLYGSDDRVISVRDAVEPGQAQWGLSAAWGWPCGGHDSTTVYGFP